MQDVDVDISPKTIKPKNNMERIPVSSSNVGSIGYEAETSTLEVGFNNGLVYQYHGVPQDVYDAFMQAGSKGTFLNSSIKGSYGFTKM